MEDSSWEGWTNPANIPPAPPGFELGYPEGRKLPSGPPGSWHGDLRALPRATDETIRFASRTWTQMRPKDFERTGRRRCVERATGVEYALCHGNPLLGDPEVADVFFAEDGSLWFLQRVDRPRVRSQWVGEMGAVRP
jgi:hypothetical protein